MLDAGCQASPGMWYLLAVSGDGPSPRVGHASCLASPCIQNENVEDEERPTSCEKQQGLIIVGGATPAGPFSDVYFLELCKYLSMFVLLLTSIHSLFLLVCALRQFVMEMYFYVAV